MFIIIEGIDGSGKSGLIDTLTDYYPNYKRADIRAQWEKVDKKDMKARKKFFKDYFAQHSMDKIIIDRFHISEAVYDRTLRNTETDIANFEADVFGPSIKDVILIVVDVHEEVAQVRIKKRDGKEEKQDLAAERSMFSTAFTHSTIPSKLFIYNDKIEMLTKGVKEFIEDVCGISGKILKR